MAGIHRANASPSAGLPRREPPKSAPDLASHAQRSQVEAATITGMEAIVETKMASLASRVRTW